MRILVIDDDVSWARYVTLALERRGLDVRAAYDPNHGLELACAGLFDAVITDIDMPTLDGISLAQMIRAQHPDMPLAFATGSDLSTSTVQDAYRLGPVLTKPFSRQDLEIVLEILYRQHAQRGIVWTDTPP